MSNIRAEETNRAEHDAPLELVVFVGLQASGKTSFYHAFFSDTHVHVSKDLFPNNRNKARRQAQLIEQAFGERRSVVLDNTNPTPEDRAASIALAHSYGARVTGYVFVTDVTSALERNRTREGRARVPDVALYVTRAKLRPPTPQEGFDRLYEVRLTREGTFDITERTTDEQ